MSKLAAELEKIRRQRGYLLPHHGLMATAMPEVLDAYDSLYRLLAFSPRTLSEHDHELVWLAILAARRHQQTASHRSPPPPPSPSAGRASPRGSRRRP